MCTSSSARWNCIDAALDLGQNLIEALERSRGIGLAMMMPWAASMAACALEARDVLGAEPLVEADGGVYLLHDRGRARRETAAPHLVAHDLLLTTPVTHDPPFIVAPAHGISYAVAGSSRLL